MVCDIELWRFEVTRKNDESHKNYWPAGKRIENLLTHTVAMPEANSFDVATMRPQPAY